MVLFIINEYVISLIDQNDAARMF